MTVTSLFDYCLFTWLLIISNQYYHVYIHSGYNHTAGIQEKYSYIQTINTSSTKMHYSVVAGNTKYKYLNKLYFIISMRVSNINTSTLDLLGSLFHTKKAYMSTLSSAWFGQQKSKHKYIQHRTTNETNESKKPWLV